MKKYFITKQSAFIEKKQIFFLSIVTTDLLRDFHAI